MQIYIDNVRMDTDERTVVSLTLAINSVADPDKNRAGYSNPIVLPVTAVNRKVMGGSDQINSAGIFNRSTHCAKVLKDGCVVMEGTATLLASSAWENGDTGTYYRVAIIGGAKTWASYAASVMLRSLGIGFTQTISASMIGQSWTWDHPVRFLPVQRDGFQVENAYSNLIRPAKILGFEDYHPFLHLKTLLDRIFEEAGYRLGSRFMETEFFSKLYITGNYPTKEAAAVKSRMNFRAGRFAPVSATADTMGRVYANPYLSYSSLGNIVESADPEEVRDGEKITGVFDNGGCFLYDGDRISFVPHMEVAAAFEYRIFYTTDYRIVNRYELAGFNTIYLDDGPARSFPLVNRNPDRREEFTNRKVYTVIVFEHAEGSVYKFAHDEINGSVTSEYSYGDSNAGSFSITVNSSYEVANPRLYIRNSSGNYVNYAGDWALYDGYVAETGTMEVELKIRSTAGKFLPSAPKYFSSIYFGGADPGMRIMLSRKTTLRPIFAQYPTLGSTIQFEDVAAHRVSGLDLIKSVKHLFNLKFYTDELSKTVFAEPPEGFYASGPAVDWSDKIDHSRQVIIREPGIGTAAIITYCYRSGDGSVTRRNHSAGDTLGKWSFESGNILSTKGEQTHENGMFTASLNQSGDYPDAPDASLIQAGDRETTMSDDLEDLNFLPKIVVYEGMRPLPAGQRWGWPSAGSSYPYLSFHHTGEDNTGTGDVEPFTLCFEDRDGIEGLHRHRDSELSRQVGAKTVEVYMNLGPEDIEPFIRPNVMKKNFRGLYKLTVGSETALYRLEEISGYTPSGTSPVKCRFIMEFPLV